VRVLLDSNVWLAILTTDGFCRRVWRATRRVCKFVVSRDILEEIEEKRRLKFGVSYRHARLMTLFVSRQTEAAQVVTIIKICRDADDNRILAAALDSGCSHRVTGTAGS
jgi:putative PIN family toxin of toxin-antitoxin system